jgi:hypothetical protein
LVTDRKKLADGTETGVIVTQKGLRHPITVYRVNGFYVIDYRPGQDGDPGFGRFFFRVSARGNRVQAGRGVVMDCACSNGAITANAAVTDVPAMLLTSSQLTPEDSASCCSASMCRQWFQSPLWTSCSKETSRSRPQQLCC